VSLGGGRKPLPSKASPPIENEREFDDDEVEELALTFCSSEILNGMVDSNWKTRLANVQEFSQVCVNFFIFFFLFGNKLYFNYYR